MLLPSKQLPLSESILALGAHILNQLDEPATVDLLWQRYRSVAGTPVFRASHSFDQFLAALSFLYSLGLLELTEFAEVRKCDF